LIPGDTIWALDYVKTVIYCKDICYRDATPPSSLDNTLVELLPVSLSLIIYSLFLVVADISQSSIATEKVDCDVFFQSKILP